MEFKIGDIVYDTETKDKLMCYDPERSLFYDQNFELTSADSKNLILYENFLLQEKNQNLQSHIKGLIELAINHSNSDCARKASYLLSDISFKREFKTLSIRLPRQNGMTTAIMNIAERDDLIVMANPSHAYLPSKASLISARSFYSYAMQDYPFEANRIFFDVKIDPNFKDVPYLAKANLYVFSSRRLNDSKE